MTSNIALLALEFSGKHSSVALAVKNVAGSNAGANAQDKTHTNGDAQPNGDEFTYFQRQSEGPRGRFLLHEVDQLLQQADLPRQALAGVIAGIGPGSYTGLRIACAAAHALGFALEIPYAGIGSFEAAVLSAPEGVTVHILQDAYRGEAYYARGLHLKGAVTLQDGPQVLAMDAIPDSITSENSFLICDERLSGKLARPEDALLRPLAADLLKIAVHRGVNAEGQGWASLPPAEPLYLRAAAFRS
jgi:tRNA threonylcarbamoyl adenosine modification protein YeaZ